MTDESIDIPKKIKDEPKRPANEIEIRRAVDILCLSLGHRRGADERQWKEDRYLTFSGHVRGGIERDVAVPEPKGTITFAELKRKLMKEKTGD
jgi:hypothetical protein